MVSFYQRSLNGLQPAADCVSLLLLSGDNMHFDFSAGKLASSWTKKIAL